MAHGAWRMAHGAWRMGAWRMVHGAWCMAHGRVEGGRFAAGWQLAAALHCEWGCRGRQLAARAAAEARTGGALGVLSPERAVVEDRARRAARVDQQYDRHRARSRR
eukprot:6484205-Prymnesium_polylepis.1